MANKIQVRRGLRAHLPILSVGELGFCTDTKELFIGSASGNVAIANLDHVHDFTHDHHELYYQKSEVDQKLATKSNIDHTHTEYASQTYVDSELSKKTDKTTTSYHINNTTVHVTQADKDNWNNKADKSYVDSALAGKADLTTLNEHTSNTIVHVTQADKDNWNSKQDALGFTPAKETGVIDTGTSGGTAFSIEETDPSKRAALILKRAGGRSAGFFWYGNDYPTYGGKFRIHLDDKSDVLFTNVNDILVDGKKVFHEGNFTPSTGITVGTTKPTDGSMWYEVIG